MTLLPLFFRSNTRDAAAPATQAFLRSALLWMSFLVATTAYAQQPFITTWKTDHPGVSNSTSITIPTTGSGYNYEVDWNNDGTYDQTGLTGSVTHDFGVAGTYTIRIRGTFRRIYFNGGGDGQKLLDVGQWGAPAWTSMAFAFYGCSNLQISATDLPNLSGVTNMSGMFGECFILNGPANIGSWNTTAATNMSGMFEYAAAFNQPINSWNTANVTNMNSMFAGTVAFNQPLNSWNTANVINMNSMWNGATAFNQPIGNWNTANVTSMSGMFLGATAFNQPLNSWNTAAVTDMGNMFSAASTFNQSINSWNTAAVTNMASMFFGATAFNQSLGTWNTAAVTSMAGMFRDATTFNQPLSTWNTAAVTSMASMFAGATAFNQPIGNWNTANVTNMASLFFGAAAFNQPIGNWNTANVTSMNSLFSGAAAFNQPIGNWHLQASVNLINMLNASGLDCDQYSATLVGWSDNPATPNGRSLGAFGRQYGNNALAARTNLTASKGWTITGDAASGQDCPLSLSVNWLAFTGKPQGDGVLLEWQTASEHNNAGFYVERSTDGLRWTEIGLVAGKGTTSEAQNYSFWDEKPLSGGLYYRLRQTDFHGKEERSKVVRVELQPAGTVRAFPNPVSNGELHLLLPEHTEEEITVQLFNPMGQLLRSIIISNDLNVLDVSGLAPGIYYLEVAGKPEWTMMKIVVGN